MDKGPGKGELVKRYRNEWKYCCSEEQLAMLAQRIRPLLEPDVHGDENGKYVIDLYRTGDEGRHGTWLQYDCGVIRVELV